MKNIVNLLGIILITFLIFSCSSDKVGFDGFEIEAKKTTYTQTSPSGYIRWTEYTFPAEIVTYHNDTLWVKANQENSQVDIIIKVPGQGHDGILPVGTVVGIKAIYKKPRTPNLDWKYEVSYLENTE